MKTVLYTVGLVGATGVATTKLEGLPAVIKVIEDILVENGEQQEEEQKTWKVYDCWAQDTLTTTANDIDAALAKKDEHHRAAFAAQSKSETAAANVAEAEDNLKTAQDALAKTQANHAKYIEKKAEEETDLNAMVGALDQAYAAIESKTGGAFLAQTGQKRAELRKTVEKALAHSSLDIDSSKVRSMKAFLQGQEGSRGSSSAVILGTLESLKKEFEGPNGISHPDFDQEEHFQKHNASIKTFNMQCWFEISSFYGQFPGLM